MMIKKIQLLMVTLFVVATGYAQVGIGTTTPDGSAALDVSATDKGFLMPRMTTAQREAIATPAAGLQVYDLDTNTIWNYNGTDWTENSGAGKFVDGDTPEIAYYDGRVGIGRSNFSPVHKLWVEGHNDTGGTNVPLKVVALSEALSTNTNTIGVTSEITNKGDGSNYGIGVNGKVTNNDGGNLYVGVGSWLNLTNTNHTELGFGSIFEVMNNNGGTMSSATGISVNLTNESGGSMGDVYGGYFGLVNSGTVDNSYGVFISSGFDAGTDKNYAVYSESAADSYFNGNVGVGVELPQQKVHISGALRLEPQATAPANGALGDLYVGTDSKLYFHDGTSWKEVQLVP